LKPEAVSTNGTATGLRRRDIRVSVSRSVDQEMWKFCAF